MGLIDRLGLRRVDYVATEADEMLPTRLASAQPALEIPSILLRGSMARQEWQERARRYAREVGVVRFSAGLTASTVSRCPMQAEQLVDSAQDHWVASDDPIPNMVLRLYRNSRDTSRELVRRHVWHRLVSGECIQTLEQGVDGIEWFVYSSLAVQIFAGQPILVKDLPGGTVFNGGAREVPPENVTRFWVPDEDYPLLATSPMQAILDDCERYITLGRRTQREAHSALGLNGILYTSEKAHKYPLQPDGKPSKHSQLDQDLAAIAAKAWDDDTSIAGIAPYSLHDDTGQKPEWISIGKALDPRVLDARREALECIVRGLPIPNVIGIEGTSGANSNHWEGWLVSEDFFKQTIAPTADEVFHSDLTDSMLRPTLSRLRAAGRWSGDPDSWRVGYDPTPVVIHPDKAGRAVEIYKLGGLKLETMLDENGFDPTDAPDDAELAKFIETQQALRERITAPNAPVPQSPTVDDGTTVEGPPQQALSASLAPFPGEVAGWLEDTRA